MPMPYVCHAGGGDTRGSEGQREQGERMGGRFLSPPTLAQAAAAAAVLGFAAILFQKSSAFFLEALS